MNRERPFRGFLIDAALFLLLNSMIWGCGDKGQNHSVQDPLAIEESGPAAGNLSKNRGGEISAPDENRILTLEECLQPYTGPSAVEQDNSTLYNKVMCGYQGWFGHEDDGYNAGSKHWGPILNDPPRCTVDLWPDMSELDEDEKYRTNYRYSDGSTAYVFSSRNRKTVLRHFKWMKEHNIHGAFKQRFGSVFMYKGKFRQTAADLAVLAHVREGANRYGRAFAVMYDVSFNAETCEGMIEDWKVLYHQMKITDTPAYIRHRGGPVVTFWGYADKNRPWDPVAAEKLFKFVTAPENGGCTIMVGVPDNNWAQWDDERMELLKKYVTIVSPWSVGRYGSPEGARAFFKRLVPGDLKVCEAHDKDYYPVIFPGFSWANLKVGAALDSISRLHGKFFWSQAELVKAYGINMVYVAMFDEVDEATAIFKCSNHPPEGRFTTYEGMPPDFYMHLTGLAGDLISGKDAEFPDIEPEPVTYEPMSALDYYRDESHFSPETYEQWKSMFSNVPVLVDTENFGKWALELNNVAPALNMYFKPWTDIVTLPPSKYVILMAQKNDVFTTGDATMDEVRDFIKKSMIQGSLLLVMADGTSPLRSPDRGAHAEEIGFRLTDARGDRECTVEFHPVFQSGFKGWIWNNLSTKTPNCRLMHKDEYPVGTKYTPLAVVKSKNGEYLGDAAAVVIPGGMLGKGKVVYVSNMLSTMPQHRKKQFLEIIITKIGETLK